jgi:Fur family ferric uptake transcriptional regulator
MDLDPIPAETGARPMSIVEPLCAVFRRRLKAEGQKYTPERARVLDAVIQMDGLFEADQLLDELRAADYRVSKATVYRTIRLMQDAGIVQRVLAAGDQPRYQLVYGARPADLLIRIDTGQTIAIDVPELIAIRDRICRQHGLDPTGHKLQIFASGPAG